MTQLGVQSEDRLGEDERWWLGSDGGQSDFIVALVKNRRLCNTARAALLLNVGRFGIFTFVKVDDISQTEKNKININHFVKRKMYQVENE